VEGAIDVPAELVLSESHLEDGRLYSEDDLHAAVDRVRRLPFILDADLALERGSERGKLRLVIAVEEVRRFFFGGEAVATRFGRDLALDEPLPQAASARVAPLAGRRFFAGRYGVFFAAVGDGPTLAAGYTRYRLFGRPALLHLELRHADDGEVTVPPLALDPTFSGWSSDGAAESGSLTLGVPLGDGGRSLRLVASLGESGDGRRRPLIGEPDVLFRHRGARDRQLELAWISDTRDDPRFATYGSRLQVALEHRTFGGDSLRDAGSDPETAAGGADLHSRLLRAAVTAERHWPLGDRQSLSLTVRAGVGRSRVENLPLAPERSGTPSIAARDLDVVEGSLALRHALKVWQARRGRTPTQEVYWENTLYVGHEEISPALGPSQSPLTTWSLTSALTWRSIWGVFRLGIAYIDVGRTL
jgi:hypothetical protein